MNTSKVNHESPGPLIAASGDSPADDPPRIATEYAFTATVKVGEPLVVDPGQDGVRRYIPITGGLFSGPLIKGHVLGVGGDSQVIRADGVIVVEARYMLKTDDNFLISVLNRGVRRASPAVMARLINGERVARDEYYFRTVAQFEAPHDSPYAALNRSLFIGTAERHPAAAIIHFYGLL